MVIFTLHPAPSIESSANGKPAVPSIAAGWLRTSHFAPPRRRDNSPGPLPAPEPPPSQLEKDATMGDEFPSLALPFLDGTADAGRPPRDAASRRGKATGPL
ncbi:hypothetical protein ACRE_043820 [Hapsidospora chrysogenum ATCC 11550]|uniref:Uncharacterized protein n=1 Tax=Hapsidospora chrysogenum (strain ATCC 11550 / CBS 779.69 / DSM 880 / IAM 14645 / JCM 23072 / IMI 49137) TaxID=857340 RepID=A0A086T637_HAPC1|nr:hypothetical protein ACRE_043820 [Hapsidospora chrysogenum ATCC 11550]